MTRTAAALAAGALALTLAACTPGAEAADVFTIAYLPGESTVHNIDARQSMADALSEAIGMEVVEFHTSDHAAIVEAMRRGQVDMAYLGPLSFARAADRAGAEAIAMRALDADPAQAFYHTAFVVRADSDIQSINDFAGRTIAFVDPDSTSGNLVPVNEIINAFPDLGLTQDDLHTGGVFFSGVTFSGQHQAGVRGVIMGDVDIAPISDTILNQELALGHVDADEIRVVHKSAPIPSEPMAVRGGLCEELREKVRAFLLAFDDEDYFEGVLGDSRARFIAATLEDFAPVIELDRLLSN